ncbi:MAG: hypothetical protein ABIJ97_06760, partial [Bacteroidota bacterium]
GTIQKNFENNEKPEENAKLLALLKTELEKLSKDPDINKFKEIAELVPEKYNEKVLKKAETYLNDVKSKFTKLNTESRKAEDKKIGELIGKFAKEDTSINPNEKYIEFSNKYNNKALEDMVLKRLEIDYIREADGELVQIKDPIYKTTESYYGRAQFYAPEKIIFGKKIDTIWFNIMVIWFTTLIMYVALLTDGLRKMIEFSGKIKIRMPGKKNKTD